MDMACDIAIEATSTVAIEENGRREIDIKRYAKVEKVLHIDWNMVITHQGKLCHICVHIKLLMAYLRKKYIVKYIISDHL